MAADNTTRLPGDFLEGLRHAADEDENAGHHLQADYIRKAADEIERLHGILLGAAVQSNPRLAMAVVMKGLETIRSPAVDHWMGRGV